MSDNGQRISRKDLLNTVLQSVVLLGLGAVGYRTLESVRSRITDRTENGKPSQHQGSAWYGMVIDIEKCIGCGLCVEACSKENNVPEGHYRTWIERYVVKEDGSFDISSPDGGINGFGHDIDDKDVARSFFVPKLCNHCDDSPCTQVCPVGATFETEDGVILIDYDWCIGCAYCIQACPYGSRFWNPEKRTADKCTLCYHRIKKDLLPVCVEVCPTHARIFGDLSDKESLIATFIRENSTMVLKPHLKTGAKVQYKGMSKEVV